MNGEGGCETESKNYCSGLLRRGKKIHLCQTKNIFSSPPPHPPEKKRKKGGGEYQTLSKIKRSGKIGSFARLYRIGRNKQKQIVSLNDVMRSKQLRLTVFVLKYQLPQSRSNIIVITSPSLSMDLYLPTHKLHFNLIEQ